MPVRPVPGVGLYFDHTGGMYASTARRGAPSGSHGEFGRASSAGHCATGVPSKGGQRVAGMTCCCVASCCASKQDNRGRLILFARRRPVLGRMRLRPAAGLGARVLTTTSGIASCGLALVASRGCRNPSAGPRVFGRSKKRPHGVVVAAELPYASRVKGPTCRRRMCVAGGPHANPEPAFCSVASRFLQRTDSVSPVADCDSAARNPCAC
mmetsp:Transcript_33954/g.101069  ORF Transcript_33954/g.101069 Transcript_33954/m.101069 type:complete len:210 (-) Transcript_33954:116-745(-)